MARKYKWEFRVYSGGNWIAHYMTPLKCAEAALANIRKMHPTGLIVISKP